VRSAAMSAELWMKRRSLFDEHPREFYLSRFNSAPRLWLHF